MRLFVAAVLFVLFLPAAALAHAFITRDTAQTRSAVFAIGANKYYVDGNPEGISMDVRPFMQDGRAFVSVRYLSNAIGVTDENITWDDSQQKAGLKLGANSVKVVIGVPRISINGRAKDIDVAPILNESEGRTYLPA